MHYFIFIIIITVIILKSTKSLCYTIISIIFLFYLFLLIVIIVLSSWLLIIYFLFVILFLIFLLLLLIPILIISILLFRYFIYILRFKFSNAKLFHCFIAHLQNFSCTLFIWSVKAKGVKVHDPIDLRIHPSGFGPTRPTKHIKCNLKKRIPGQYR